ncbi:MAG: 2-hydroxyacyl-CoA dehydratase [Chloroflexi bacterium]|nr:2-hydroxyacyl-CoA dehydratase [Chloroflexota bacterium]
MALDAYETSPMEQVLKGLAGMCQHLSQKSANPWDGLYCELLHKYFENIVKARERGQFVATQSDSVQCEAVYAMDMVPFHISMVSCTLAAMLRKQESLLSTAKAFGLPPEVCSVHRLAAAVFLQRWAPPVDAIVWNNETCDNNAKSSELLTQICGVPGFYFDSPYYADERGVKYLEGELGDLFQFLGRVSGKPLRQERLQEVLRLSQQALELNREINELRAAVPYPANGRLGLQLFLVRWYWAGTENAIRFMELVRDELKRRVAAGGRPKERHRFLSQFLTPNHSWKLLDWMEREHGAYVVNETNFHHFGPIQWDFSQPVRTLARRCLAEPVAFLTYAPVERWVKAVREDVKTYKADGVIFWAHTGCRQANPTIRIVKETVQAEGVPCLVLDVDTNDPSFVSDDALKERIEGFTERLE